MVGVIRTYTWEGKDTGQARSRNIIARNVAVSLKYVTVTVHPPLDGRSDTNPAQRQ